MVSDQVKLWVYCSHGYGSAIFSQQNDKLVDASPATRVQAALERMRVDPSHYPSFEERMGIDVTAVLCTVIELCCMRQLRAAIPINATLTQRVGTIKKVLKSGQLKLPS